MRIHTVWATRQDTPEDPELVVAWDDYSVDGNPEGFEADVKDSLASWGSDLSEFRHITLEVPDDELDHAFGVTVIPATVKQAKPKEPHIEQVPTVLENTGQTVWNVHPKVACQGRPCTIHNRSNHHMRTWPQNFRADRGMMERICDHGVGHPDPDDPTEDTVHGCDGCCAPR